MRELLPRTITAVALGAAILAMLVLGKVLETDVPFALLIGAITLLVTLELAQLAQRFGVPLERLSLCVLNVAIAAAIVLFQDRFISLGVFTAALLWPLLWYSLTRRSLKPTLVSWFVIAYIPIPLQFTFHLYNQSEGMYYLAFLLALVWAYDIAAYFAGSFWGREKLLPEVSPAKTWEGVLGGFAGALLVALSSPLWVPHAEWSLPWLLVVLFVSIATQLGDLFESWLKRFAKVKDAGELLPGHGGLLDRIDGLLFAAPVFYFYLRYILNIF